MTLDECGPIVSIADIKDGPTLTQINMNLNTEDQFTSVSITWYTSGFQKKY